MILENNKINLLNSSKSFFFIIFLYPLFEKIKEISLNFWIIVTHKIRESVNIIVLIVFNHILLNKIFFPGVLIKFLLVFLIDFFNMEKNIKPVSMSINFNTFCVINNFI